MSKIAPTLQHFVSARTCHQGECGGDAECEKVEKELRALLAVARAARHYRIQDCSPLATGREASAARSLDRAIARLEKVSR
jgi:hypothetical protein